MSKFKKFCIKAASLARDLGKIYMDAMPNNYWANGYLSVELRYEPNGEGYLEVKWINHDDGVVLMTNKIEFDDELNIRWRFNRDEIEEVNPHHGKL